MKKQELLEQLKTLEKERDSLCDAILSLQNDIEELDKQPLEPRDLVEKLFPYKEFYEIKFTWFEALELVKAAEANNKLRHISKHSLEECMNKRCVTSAQYEFGYTEGFKDAEKNRGYHG